MNGVIKGLSDFCGHFICVDCLYSFFVNHVHKLPGLVCPIHGCFKAQSVRHLKGILGSRRLSTVVNRLQRSKRLSDPLYIECNTVDCVGHGLLLENQAFWTCPLCFSCICAKCKKQHDENITCIDFEHQYLQNCKESERRTEIFLRNNAKPCPNGHYSLLELNLDSSFHCCCNLCGIHFCYCCGGVYDHGHFAMHTSHCLIVPLTIAFVEEVVYDVPLIASTAHIPLTYETIVLCDLTEKTCVECTCDTFSVIGTLPFTPETLSSNVRFISVHFRRDRDDIFIVRVVGFLGCLPFIVTTRNNIKMRNSMFFNSFMVMDADDDEDAEVFHLSYGLKNPVEYMMDLPRHEHVVEHGRWEVPNKNMFYTPQVKRKITHKRKKLHSVPVRNKIPMPKTPKIRPPSPQQFVMGSSDFEEKIYSEISFNDVKPIIHHGQNCMCFKCLSFRSKYNLTPYMAVRKLIGMKSIEEEKHEERSDIENFSDAVVFFSNLGEANEPREPEPMVAMVFTEPENSMKEENDFLSQQGENTVKNHSYISGVGLWSPEYNDLFTLSD
ncbi:hypothetical protein PCE1_001541 [Barthelona sp. PCE]